MPRPISLTISTSSLRHNLDVVIERLTQASVTRGIARPKVWAVVKANAYGHGVNVAVDALARADGLAMLDLDEAVRVREAGWKGPVMLLEGFFEPSDLDVVDEYRLMPVLHCQEQLDMLQAARLSQPIDAYVKLNTGMNRLGFMPQDYAGAWSRAQMLHDQKVLGRLGKMTHFSCADDDPDVTRAEQQLFQDITADLPGPVSLCNSAATLTDSVWSAMDPDLEQWVRPGICLYGGSPFASRSAASFGFKPVQTLSAQLIAVRELPAGVSIGYGREYTTPAVTRTGIVACGYADGYPRLTSPDTPVSVNGVPTRLLGRVSMDMLVVDITSIPQAGPGSTVVLWGEGGPEIDDVARCARTIGYELMCAVAPRVPRRYI